MGAVYEVFLGSLGLSWACLGVSWAFWELGGVLQGCTGGQDGIKKDIKRFEVVEEYIMRKCMFSNSKTTFVEVWDSLVCFGGLLGSVLGFLRFVWAFLGLSWAFLWECWRSWGFLGLS